VCIVVLVSIPAAMLWWRPGLWIDVFSAEPAVHDVGARYFRIVGPTYPFVAVSMVLAFAFQGMGRAMVPLAWMFVRVIAVLVAAVVCVRWLVLDERAVFAAVAIANVTSAVVMVPLFLYTERRLVLREPVAAPGPAPA
jgi:Na+-driven multidrug efflux pump